MNAIAGAITPQDTRESITAVGQWCQQNLTPFGAYVGMDLRSEGFPYARGEYVPVDKRYSAMLSHRRAMRVMGLGRVAA